MILTPMLIADTTACTTPDHEASVVTAAVSSYAADVRSGAFPSDEESYHGSAELRESLSAGT